VFHIFLLKQQLGGLSLNQLHSSSLNNMIHRIESKICFIKNKNSYLPIIKCKPKNYNVIYIINTWADSNFHSFQKPQTSEPKLNGTSTNRRFYQNRSNEVIHHHSVIIFYFFHTVLFRLKTVISARSEYCTSAM